MTEFMKKYKLKITVLTPVHIGAATDLEPTEYVIFSENGEREQSQKQPDSAIICPECGYRNPANAEFCGDCGADLPRQTLPARQTATSATADCFLYTFTPGQLSAALSPADKALLLKEARTGDLTTLQNFFKNKAASIVKTATKRALVCREVSKKYAEKFGKVNSRDNDFSKFNIEKQISDPTTGTPYIPGSSIKGAIRTALMSRKNERLRLDKDYKKGADAEKTLYGYQNPTNDPFKALKVEDGHASKTFMTKIDTAENVKRNSAKILNPKGGLSTYIEVIPSGTVFESSLSIMQNGFDMVSIQKSCNDFYADILSDQEDHQIHTHGVSAVLFEKIRKSVEKSKPAFLLCMGKHGGAESKTIEGLRNIRIMQGKGKQPRFGDHATTYWFANDGKERQPFGWCVVELEEMK